MEEGKEVKKKGKNKGKSHTNYDMKKRKKQRAEKRGENQIDVMEEAKEFDLSLGSKRKYAFEGDDDKEERRGESTTRLQHEDQRGRTYYESRQDVESRGDGKSLKEAKCTRPRNSC